MDKMTATTTEVKVRHPDALIVYGPLLLVVGILMTSGPALLSGLLVGGLGIAMLTVWMLRHYR